MNLAELRREYSSHGLIECDMCADPLAQFAKWFEQAQEADIVDVNAATLATCSTDGKPSARIVLVKGFGNMGFMFFTSYDGRKARELSSNPQAALVLFWADLERQVRIEGVVQQVSRTQSEEYHKTRPRGSQLSAWASQQSVVIKNREELETRLKDVESRFGEGDVPCPPNWGGYLLAPEVIEFWQGRPNRLHDRIRYRRDGLIWVMERLAP